MAEHLTDAERQLKHEMEHADNLWCGCNPAAVLGVLSELGQLREENQKLRNAIKNFVEIDDVLNADECARLLGFGAYFVREKARAGDIPGRKVGREWRFSRRQLLEWLEKEGEDG